MRFSTSCFFHESVSPKPWPWVSYSVEFVRKFAEIFASQGAPSVSMTPAATGINGRRYCWCHWYQWQIYHWCRWHPPVSLISTARAVLVAKFAVGVVETDGKFFLPMSLILMVHHDLRISPWVFEHNRNDTSVFFRGLGEDDSWKKPKAKNLIAMSLSSVLLLQRLERNSVDLWIKEDNS